MDILHEIAEHTKRRVCKLKEQYPLAELIDAASALPKQQSFPFEAALSGQELAFICEVKRASPSKGMIVAQFPYCDIAKEYEAAGAAAISVLTEPDYFKGHNQYLSDIATVVSLPILRKDFIVDEYMIYEAKILGASAVLLICAILEPDTLTSYIKLAHELGLSALVEVHDEAEIAMALTAGARIIGVNNRDLKSFQVDVTLSVRLRALVPDTVLFVAESGIKTANDIKMQQEHQVDAVLIGETFMRAADKKRELARLRGQT